MPANEETPLSSACATLPSPVSGVISGNRQPLSVLLTVLRLVLGVIFLYSGLEKILHPYDFLGNVYDFELTGAGLGMIVAMIMPWLELLLALSLLLNLLPAGSLFGCALLGFLFVGVQFSAIARGLSVNCGCFGPDESKLVGFMTFARTCIIAMAALAAWLLNCAIQYYPLTRRAPNV